MNKKNTIKIHKQAIQSILYPDNEWRIYQGGGILYNGFAY